MQDTLQPRCLECADVCASAGLRWCHRFPPIMANVPAVDEPEQFRRNIHVVLCQPRNPLNIGAAARAVSNFGCGNMRLVSPFDLAFREAVSAVGGAQVLRDAQVFDTVPEAIADCRLVVGTTAVGNRELQHVLQRMEAAGPELRRSAQNAPVALLFGSEKFGLTNEEMSHCHWLAHIPTSPETPSMNLGQAVAICLYEVMRETGLGLQWPHQRPMRASDSEQITEMLLASASGKRVHQPDCGALAGAESPAFSAAGNTAEPRCAVAARHAPADSMEVPAIGGSLGLVASHPALGAVWAWGWHRTQVSRPQHGFAH